MNGKLTSGDLVGLTRDTTRLEEAYALRSTISSLRNGSRGNLNISIGLNGAHGSSTPTVVPGLAIHALSDEQFTTLIDILIAGQEKLIERDIDLIRDRYGVHIEG